MTNAQRCLKTIRLCAVLVGTAFLLVALVFGLAPPLMFYFKPALGVFGLGMVDPMLGMEDPMLTGLLIYAIIVFCYIVAPWRFSWVFPVAWSTAGMVAVVHAMARNFVT